MQKDEVFSNEVKEIISFRPSGLIRNGNVILLLIILLLISFTWLIKYPDMVKCSMKLSAVFAPERLSTKKDGLLVGLFVNNEQDVKKGQQLAFIQSTANHIQVLSLQKQVDYILKLVEKGNINGLDSFRLQLFDELGELQGAYEDFQTSFAETVQILGKGYYQQKKRALKIEQTYLSSLKQNTVRQQILLQQDFNLMEIEYKANESLANDKVIAPLELNQTKSKMLSKKQTLEQIDAQITNNFLTEQSKRKEILDLQKYIGDQNQKFVSGLILLKSKIDDWLFKYVITAPENGKIYFTSFLQKNQLLTAGQELFYLQPVHTLYYAQMKSPQAGLGKIKSGQKVLIDVNSYPSYEYGQLWGTVEYISNMPTETDSFLIKVNLDNGLLTSYHKMIYFRNNLSAEAEVITSDRRLSDRFLGQINDLLKR